MIRLIINILWIAICIYCTVSFILLKYPLILKKKGKKGKKSSNDRRPARRASLIAHRGSRVEGLPENTIAAFREASKIKDVTIELDVWLSRDGHVVVFHDEDFRRMSGDESRERVVDLDYHCFPLLKPAGSQLSNKCREYAYDEIYRVPLFIDVIRSLPDEVSVIVEFKQDSDELVQKVVDILMDRGIIRYSNVYWFSLVEKINSKLRRHPARIPTITSVPTMLATLGLYYAGLLPFADIDDDVFGITVSEITLEDVRHEKAVEFLPDGMKRLLAWLLRGRPPRLMLAPALFAHLRSRNIEVWFLGVNSEEDLVLARAAGATAILTDRIAWASKFVQENNISFQKL